MINYVGKQNKNVMESKRYSSAKKISNQEEKIIREVDYDALAQRSRVSKKPIDKIYINCNRKVVVCIKPKAPVIKTLYIAEKNRFTPQKHSDRSGSRLAIGDNSSVTSPYSDENTTCVSTITCTSTLTNYTKYRKQSQNSINPDESSSLVSEKSELNHSTKKTNVENVKQCFAYSRPKLIAMTFPNIKNNNFLKTFQAKPDDKIDTSEKVFTKDISPNLSIAQQIFQKINYLEDRILQQEMVLHSINQTLEYSSSDEEANKNEKKDTSNFGRPGCSYIEYSHIPKTAFQKHQQQSAEPLSISKATTIRKEHNSEQYGRDYTLYDNVTARGRRQSASVPGKRNNVPKLAAERVHKIRHKLNLVRDYRLMDTVHYLAQGEFAPRDDGIKLTPSREAVLSDIIWEDVCRTHWPNTRLARRAAHAERCSTRSDLQRLIDSLLRERVAHIERKRRRHYRVVKLNHRHENYQSLGKTGDIIVASNKNKHKNEEKKFLSDRNECTTERIRSPLRSNRSSNRMTRSRERSRPSECSPGPSHAVHLSRNKKPTYCYHAENSQTKRMSNANCDQQRLQEPSSNISIINNKIHPKNPRLVIKKNSSLRRYRINEPNLEHFILLPTLVVRTPSNVRRQKKFNELYHRILNAQLKKDQNDEVMKIVDQNKTATSTKKDIGLNVNITLSESKEKL